MKVSFTSGEFPITVKINGKELFFTISAAKELRMKLDDNIMKYVASEQAKQEDKKMANKKCEICGKNPATIPDRERIGRLINRVCSRCHALRLAGDLTQIKKLQEERRTLI